MWLPSRGKVSCRLYVLIYSVTRKYVWENIIAKSKIKISTPTPFWWHNLWCLFSGCNNNNKHFGNRRWKATKRQPHSSHKIYLMKLINKLWYKSWTVSGSKPPTLSVLLLQFMLLLLLLLLLRLRLLLLLLVCCCCSSNIFIKSSKLLAVACDADKRAWSAAVADVAAGPGPTSNSGTH